MTDTSKTELNWTLDGTAPIKTRGGRMKEEKGREKERLNEKGSSGSQSPIQRYFRGKRKNKGIMEQGKKRRRRENIP